MKPIAARGSLRISAFCELRRSIIVSSVLVLLAAGCECEGTGRVAGADREGVSPAAVSPRAPAESADIRSATAWGPGPSAVEWLEEHPDVIAFSVDPVWAAPDVVATLGVIRRLRGTELCVLTESQALKSSIICIEDRRQLKYFPGRVPETEQNVTTDGVSTVWALPLIDLTTPDRVLFEEVHFPSRDRRRLGHATASRTVDEYPLRIYRNPTIRDPSMTVGELSYASHANPPPGSVLRLSSHLSPSGATGPHPVSIREIDFGGRDAVLLLGGRTSREAGGVRLGVHAGGRWRFSGAFDVGAVDTGSLDATFVSLESAPEVGPDAVALRYFKITGGSHDWDATQERRVFTRQGDALAIGPVLRVQKLGYIEVPPPDVFPWVGVETEVEASPTGCINVRPVRLFEVRLNEYGAPAGHRPWRRPLPDGFIDQGSFRYHDGAYLPGPCGD